MKVWCCECDEDVAPRLTDGAEIYPHRPDLHSLPFWRCDDCGNYVGCHHKTKNRTAPLGCIPSPELRAARNELHRLIDPLWQSGEYSRRDLYRQITEIVGWRYHTAKTRSVEETEKVRQAVLSITGVNGL